jgi:integrase
MAFLRTRTSKTGIHYYIVQKTNGVEKTKRIPAKNKKEADLILAKYESDLASQTLSPLFIPKIKFKDFVEQKYLPFSKTPKAVSTYSKDLSSIKNLLSEWGDHNLGQISTESISQVQSKWLTARDKKKPIKKKTINNRIGLLKSILKMAQDMKMLGNLPEIPRLKVDEKPPRYYSDDQIRYIFSHVRPWVKDFVVVLFHTGMRVGELQRLRWKDIDFDKKNLMIPESKSHKFRVLPINATLEAKLLELKNKSSVSQEFVFKGEKGLMYSDFYHAYVREMKRIQMDGNLHMWRHTYASKLVQKGVSLYVIKDLLGHASIQTTQIYAHLRNEDLHQAVRLLVD